MGTLRVEDKIILHLSRYPRSMFETGTVPEELTQEGMAREIGTSRNYTAVALGRMERRENSVIKSELRRVKGVKKKRKVYFLTPEGWKRAQNMLREWENARVRVLVDSRAIEMPLREIGTYVAGHDYMIRALLAMDEDGTIRVNRIKEEHESVFVGRKEMMSQLVELMHAVKDGTGHCTVVYGPEGVGKTALLRRAGAFARENGWLFFYGKAYMNLEIPYFPFLSMFKTAGALSHETASRLLGYLKRVSPGLDADKISYERNVWWHKFADELGTLSQTQPVLIVVDDLQYADSTTFAFFRYLCGRVKEFRIMLLASYRAEMEELKKSCERARMLSVEPFTIEETAALISAMVNDTPPSGFVELVQRITGGHPLFVKALIERMLAEGVLVPEEGVFPLSLSEVVVPEGMGAAISQQLNALDSESQTLLGLCSVIGERIPLKLLLRVSDYDEYRINEILARLVNAGILHRLKSDIYGFSHPLFYVLSYQRTLNKRKLHKRIAKEMEALKNTEDLDEYVNLGYHYESSGEYVKALSSYLDAATSAERNYAYEAAIDMLERALRMAERMGKSEYIVQTALRLGQHYARRGQYRKAVMLYESLLNEAAVIAEVYLGLSRFYEHMGELKSALEYVNRGLKLPDMTDSDRIKLLSEKMWLLLKSGQIDDSKVLLEQEEKIAANLADDEVICVVMKDRITFLYYLGDYERAIKHIQMLITLREKMGALNALSSLYTDMGILLAHIGELDRAIEYFNRSKELDEEYGYMRGLAQTYTNLGIAHRKKGQLRDALEFFGRAKEIYVMAENMDSLAVTYFNEGNTLIDLGRFEQALAALGRSREIFEKNRDLWGLCYTYRALGECRMYMGDYSNAAELFTKSMLIAKQSENTKCLVHTYVNLGMLYIHTNELELAEALYDKLSKMNIKEDDRESCARVSFLGGLLYLKKEDGARAQACFEKSRMAFAEASAAVEEAISLYYLGRANLLLDELRTGEELLSKAKKKFEAGDMQYWLKIIKDFI